MIRTGGYAVNLKEGNAGAFQNKNGGPRPPRLLPLLQPVRFPGYLSKESMTQHLQKNLYRKARRGLTLLRAPYP
jgi:hypothetical protein